MNKGKKLKLCPICNRKRYCFGRVLLPAREWKKWTCSKGHNWDVKIGSIAQIIAIEIERISPKLMNLFERDDLFYRNLKK